MAGSYIKTIIKRAITEGHKDHLPREQFSSATSVVEQNRSVKIMFDTLVYILDSRSVFSFFCNFLFTVDFCFCQFKLAIILISKIGFARCWYECEKGVKKPEASLVLCLNFGPGINLSILKTSFITHSWYVSKMLLTIRVNWEQICLLNQTFGNYSFFRWQCTKRLPAILKITDACRDVIRHSCSYLKDQF